MNRCKMLLIIVLLVLTQFSWGYDWGSLDPYMNMWHTTLLNENSSRKGQISNFRDIDFFEVKNNTLDSNKAFPIADIELEFSCPQNNATSGWTVSLFKHFIAGSGKTDEPLKGYDVSPIQCANKFSFAIDQNEDEENIVDSYYIGVQSWCTNNPPNGMQRLEKSIFVPCDTSDYQLKLGVFPKETIKDTNTLTADELKNASSLGSIKTGQIKSDTDKNIYSVETYATPNTAGTAEVPLLFSCTQTAARYTDDWKLTVYDDKNTVVTGYPRFINGSDCGSTLVDDKGGFKFTLPKDSPRYFVSVQSACDSKSKNKCTVEKSQYNIARDVTKIYTGSLANTKSITAKNASFKLTRCGLNSNSTIAVKIENANLVEMFKSKIPMKIQIGTMACQILTPDSFAPAELMLGSITGNAEIIDTPLIAKDSISISLGECVSSNKQDVKSKITLTGTKLDLENLNPTETATTTTATTTTTTPSNHSVIIPVKVDIGDFHCEGKDAFHIDNDKPKLGDATYSNHLPADIEELSPAVNLELSKTDKIELATDVRLYYVDSSINNDTVLNFSCESAQRFNNDWKVFVYNSDKSLLGAPYVINGSDCSGDNGAYTITIPKDKGSVRYYVAVKSACDVGDSSCVVDKSMYILSRAMDAAISTTDSTTTTSITTTTPTKTAASFDSNWLLTKKNLGATLQTGQINAPTDTQVYQIDTGTEDANLTFTCLNSVRYQNDWKVLIYDSAKTLKSTTMINGSSCGIGQTGDSGAYAISLTKESSTYYLVVKAACDSDDKTCVVDKSQYYLKRVTAAQAATNAAAKPCFGTNCTAVTQPVKPFFK